jgi:hypothetical protein
MPEGEVGVKFVGDPSDAVNAAKKVQNETNKIGDEAEKTGGAFDGVNVMVSRLTKRIGLAAAAYKLLNKVFQSRGFIHNHVEDAKKLAKAIEVSLEKAQELTIAERESGLAMGSIRSAIEGIARAQAQGILSADMQNLGLSIEEIQKLRPDQLFDVVSRRLNEGGINARQFRAAIAVLGQDGADVAIKLAGGFEKFREIAKDSGRIIEESTFKVINNESRRFIATVQVMAEEVIKAVTPFETFGELAGKSLKFVNDQLELLRFGFSWVANRVGAILDGATQAEATEIASIAALEGEKKVKKRTELLEDGGENLMGERLAGRGTMLDLLTQRMSRSGQNISSLQRVGLAASAGESESIRLQRRQLFKADSMDKLLFNQNKILNEKL